MAGPAPADISYSKAQALEDNMISVHVVGPTNKPRYESELLDYHRARHKVFVDRRKWKELQRKDGLEIDEFDNEDAIYLICLSEGRVAGGVRLHSTAGPTLLSEVFPHLVTRCPLPRSYDIMDATRLFVLPSRRERSRFSAEGAILYYAQMEYLLLQGMRGFTFVSHLELVEHAVALGWRVEPLGVPKMVAGRLCVASFIHADENALQYARAAAGVDYSVLTWRGARLPAPAELTLQEDRASH
jgi:acyl-homoserine lactone synthase